MYYEEKVIDGVPHWRGTPTGKWVQCTPARLSFLLSEARTEQSALRQILRDARPFVAFAFDRQIAGAEECGLRLDAEIGEPSST